MVKLAKSLGCYAKLFHSLALPTSKQLFVQKMPLTCMACFSLPREILFGVNLGVTLNETLHSTCSKTVPWKRNSTSSSRLCPRTVETVYLFFLGVLKFRSPGTTLVHFWNVLLHEKIEQLEIEKPDFETPPRT